jgi:hypothetical protein
MRLGIERDASKAKRLEKNAMKTVPKSSPELKLDNEVRAAHSARSSGLSC